ncbi:DUF2913 family protein [Photobacterium aquimaris]|uniref:DUF2913 domain-containing protein n=1 Tax=Photobacterium aquimaris TaxID=512643 RepID=A0A2T3HW06_9GAMM|nr:DUF2913 family protein [Photobacterium aquimaris]OBU20298.1 hypothetical protein AYY21_03825 [Photobacterium aquimaris]PQJ41242.1 hypothetical protein BTN98_06265 [Photobacterium aquimaris]PSU02888.1 DUF2913 domain-containing protein [Photobacterium aquimaris]
MTIFFNEIYNVVSSGLTALQEAQATGKAQKNPVSESIFLSAWVTKVLKQHSFDRCVVKTLQEWQQQSRTMGKNAQLKLHFSRLADTYAQVTNEQGQSTVITPAVMTTFYTALEQQDWLVTNEYEVNRKVSHHTDGKASLVVCCAQYAEAMGDGDELVKPLSLYVRGNAQQFIDIAYQHGILLYKITDYKSKVKFHGEYVIYPHNAGGHLPELPTATL